MDLHSIMVQLLLYSRMALDFDRHIYIPLWFNYYVYATTYDVLKISFTFHYGSITIRLF